jgi:NhaP-type Na+/H+ or K+/H+ antiporter
VGDTVTVADLAIVAALIFGWGTLSARLERFDVTAPIIFVLAGLLLTHGPLAVLAVAPSNALIKELAEFTLALVLFSDASRVGLHELRVDAGLYARLLGVALPLTIGLGTLLALALISGNIWLALLVGAALAPTDAALGAGMMANPVVPARIRRLVNVESGLNDGIATPFVSVALAGAATGGQVAEHGPAAAVAELAVGILVGVAAGGVGGLLVNAARRHGWAADGFAGAAVLSLAVCAYASAVAVHGNGFIAAFVGGLAFGTAGGRRGEPLVPFVEETGALVSVLVWLAFGAVALVPAIKVLTWPMVLYAILSLTLVRMVPVAVALIGARLGWETVVLVAWFGPRGLASVVFALLALEELGNHTADRAVAVIAITVLISVVVHGATAEPLAARYAKRLTHLAAKDPGALMPDMPDRRLIRRSSPSQG